MARSGAVRPQYAKTGKVRGQSSTPQPEFTATNVPTRALPAWAEAAIERGATVDILEMDDAPDETRLDDEDESLRHEEADAEVPVPSPLVRDLVQHPLSTPARSSVQLAASTLEDVDRLWDWTRADPQGTTAFLGVKCQNSPQLFKFVKDVDNLELTGGAAWRSITSSDGLIGFVMLNPIVRAAGQPPVGTCHFYTEPNARGRVADLLPAVIAGWEAHIPGLTLLVITKREEWAGLLEPLGFTRQIVLVRPSSHAVTR